MRNQPGRLASPRRSDIPSSTPPETASPTRSCAGGALASARGPRAAAGPLAAAGLGAAAGLLTACGPLTGPGEGVEIVVEAAHFRAPAPVRFEIRNHGAREVITVACDGAPRVYVLRRGSGGWHGVHDSCPVEEGSFLDVGPGEVVRGSIDNLFDTGLYVLRFEFRQSREQVFPRSTRSKGFQITR